MLISALWTCKKLDYTLSTQSFKTEYEASCEMKHLLPRHRAPSGQYNSTTEYISVV